MAGAPKKLTVLRFLTPRSVVTTLATYGDQGHGQLPSYRSLLGSLKKVLLVLTRCTVPVEQLHAKTMSPITLAPSPMFIGL